jgi:hypothetical protein
VPSPAHITLYFSSCLNRGTALAYRFQVDHEKWNETEAQDLFQLGIAHFVSIVER